jgi:hypothetical protein
MSIPGYEFRMKSEIDFAVYKLSAFARSAAKAGNASLSLSAQGEDVPFTDCGIALIAAAQQVFRPAQQIRVFHPSPSYCGRFRLSSSAVHQ